MKTFSKLSLILLLGLSLAVLGCGGTEDKPKDTADSGETADTTGDGTETTDTTGDDTTGDTTTDGTDIAAACAQVCEYLIGCLGQLTCDPALGELDGAGCVQDCISRGEMNQASANNYVNQSCDDVNRSQCNAAPDQFANCDCQKPTRATAPMVNSAPFH